MQERFYSIQEAVAGYQEDLGFTTPRSENQIRRWIGEGLAEMRVFLAHYKEKEIDIFNLKAPIPDDLLKVSSIQLIDSENNCLTPLYDNSVIKCCISNPNNCQYDPRVRVTMEIDHFVFSSTIDELEITKLRLKYHALLRDNKELIIPFDLYPSLFYFCQYKYKQMLRNRHGNAESRTNPIALSEIEMARRDWYHERERSLARLKTISGQQLAQVNERWLYALGDFPAKTNAGGVVSGAYFVNSVVG